MSLAHLLRRAAEADGPDDGDSESWAELTQRVRDRVLSEAVPEQRDFILDRSQWTLALCSRQCGKGWSVARMMLLVAMVEPGSVVYYVRRTLGLAKETMWSEPRDGLPTVLRELGLEQGPHYALNLSTTEVRLANGSCIRFKGIERSSWSDVRGLKFALLVLDEMQEQEDEGLKTALQADIPYCFMRYGGRFVGIGTPGAVAHGPFHDICEDVPHPETGLGQRTGWAVHRWTAEALRDRTPVWAGMLEWKARFNVPDSFPKWRRDGLGQWAADDDSLLLPIPGPQALWDGRTLPGLIPSVVPTVLVPRRLPMHVAAGLDFGFRPDPCAVVVGSVSREEGVLRTLYSQSRGELLNDELADWLLGLVAAHGITVFYADNARNDTIEYLAVTRGLPVVPCDKGAYDARLEEMRTMMQCGRLQVEEGSELHRELAVLPPDPMQLKKFRIMRPKPRVPDHCFDALRYLFNGVHSNYLLRPDPPLTPIEAREREIQALVEREARERSLSQRSPLDHRGRRR